MLLFKVPVISVLLLKLLNNYNFLVVYFSLEIILFSTTVYEKNKIKLQTIVYLVCKDNNCTVHIYS